MARVYVAFRPPHLHAADAASLCARLIHQELIRLYGNPYEAAAWLPNARTEDEVRRLHSARDEVQRGDAIVRRDDTMTLIHQ